MGQLKNWSKGLNGNITKEEVEIVNMHMRRCLTSLEIKEIQIKVVMRDHFFTFLIGKYPNKGVEKWPPFCPVDGTMGGDPVGWKATNFWKAI